MSRKLPLLSLLLVALLLTPSVSAEEPDAFYTPPAGTPSDPGRLILSEPFTRGVLDGARAWRLLYTTSLDEDTPAVASAIVMLAANAPSGARPVILWTHGTTGVVPHCAPSLLPDPMASGGMPALSSVLDAGWAIVATDYPGLGTKPPHPYLVGQAEGRSALDAFRAARQLQGLALEDRTVVWGHSQGGHAALWTGALAASYAPELKIAGVAAMAPAGDLRALVEAQAGTAVGQVVLAYVATAYSAVYPELKLDDLIRPQARTIATQMSNLCFAPPEVVALVQLALQLAATGGGVMAVDPTAGALGARVAQNSANEPIAAPVLIAQGLTDTLVLPRVQHGFVERRCGAGQSLLYWAYEGRDHGGIVAADSPLNADLMTWTRDRFAGVSQPQGCHRVEK